MAILLRKIDGTLLALSEEKNEPKPNDIYLNDKIEHALRVKFEREYMLNGLLQNPTLVGDHAWEIIDKIEIGQ